MGHGGHYTTTGDVHGISHFSTSRSVLGFADVLCDVVEQYINFPLDRQGQQEIMQGFFDIAGFLHCLGPIDGSLIAIGGSSVDEHLYICRKGYHAINVQGVCQHESKFTNIVVKWPGSAGDGFIYNDSYLRTLFLSGQVEGGWLIGDSGYGCNEFLLTPLDEPETPAEKKYNKAHKTTRSIIERTFGLWKARFMCINKLGGRMVMKPRNCCKVIVATAILHNIAMDLGMPILDENGDEVEMDPPTEEATLERGFDAQI